MNRAAPLTLVVAAFGGVTAACQERAPLPTPKRGVLVPQVDGEWWTIAGNPDLGRLGRKDQQPVDFAIWQAKDGSWQLWSCIRNTACGGRTRLFHRWEAKKLADRDWRPLGVVMQADVALDETEGGLQAPHVLREGRDVFHMVYGDWQHICLARSRDGKTFERVLDERGKPALFSGPMANTRDPMLLKVGALYHCYYTGHAEAGDTNRPWNAAVFCRTSIDLRRWSEPVVVNAGGTAASIGGPVVNSECPFVVAHDDTFYLFRNLAYGAQNLNVQYASRNPFDFGAGDDRDYVGHLTVAAPEIFEHEGRHYIAALLPTLDGIRVAKLRWVRP